MHYNSNVGSFLISPIARFNFMAYPCNCDNHLLLPPPTNFPSTFYSTTRMTFVPFFLAILIPNLFTTSSIISHLAFCSICLEHMFDKTTCEFGWVDNFQLTHTQCLYLVLSLLQLLLYPIVVYSL